MDNKATPEKSRKKKVRPPEQFSRFDGTGADWGTDGIVLARTPDKQLVWFPGHGRYFGRANRNDYQPVSLWVIVGEKSVLLARGGRFDKLRYESLIKEMRSHLGVPVELDDIDVKRRSFTTVFL